MFAQLNLREVFCTTGWCTFSWKTLFASEQFAFQKSSCVHAISFVTDYIREKVEQKQCDTLDHSKMFEQFIAYGYRGPIFELLNDYLRTRYQIIDTDNNKLENYKLTLACLKDRS